MIIGYILLPWAYCVELCKYVPSMQMFTAKWHHIVGSPITMLKLGVGRWLWLLCVKSEWTLLFAFCFLIISLHMPTVIQEWQITSK